MRVVAVAALLALVGSVVPSADARRRRGPRGAERAIAQELFAAINNARENREMPALEPLLRDDVIDKKSFGHSRRMAKRKRMNHRGFNKRGRKIQNKLGAAQVCENVAYAKGYGPRRIDNVFFRGWDKSRGHHACMFDKNFTATHAGIGIKKRGKRFYGTFIAVRVP